MQTCTSYGNGFAPSARATDRATHFHFLAVCAPHIVSPRIALFALGALLIGCLATPTDAGSRAGTGPVFLDDGGVPPDSCECQRGSDLQGCLRPPTGPVGPANPGCGWCPTTCVGISVPVCGYGHSLDGILVCVSPLPDGGYLLADGGPNVTPSDSWSDTQFRCVVYGCPSIRDCTLTQCGDLGHRYCVPGGTNLGCNSDAHPDGGADAGCDDFPAYGPGADGTGCAEPLPDGGFYLPDGGINHVPDGGSSRFRVTIVQSKNCPWLWKQIAVDCSNNKLCPYCIMRGTYAGWCNASTPNGDIDGGNQCQ